MLCIQEDEMVDKHYIGEGHQMGERTDEGVPYGGGAPYNP